MMERKFTDAEIEKALKCCGSENCRGCPYWDYKCHGGNQMIRDALDLINRQKAYIEKVKPIHNSFERELECAKQEGIKEFAERLKQYCVPGGDFGDPCGVLTVTDRGIDYLVKEMTGENNGN